MRSKVASTATISEPESLWNKIQTARYLGISVKTLDRWMAEKRGPIGRRVGAQVRYVPTCNRSQSTVPLLGAPHGGRRSVWRMNHNPAHRSFRYRMQVVTIDNDGGGHLWRGKRQSTEEAKKA
jgi:hypothetical protein